jgi:DNA-binding NarL/FixJ family response regulator
VLVFIVDDHHLVAKGIASLLLKIEGVEAVDIFSNGRELLQAIKSKNSQLIFLDIEMPELNGEQTIEILQELYPEIPCCMLSMIDEKAVVEKFIQKGARGFMHKDSTFEELREAVQSILQGKIFYSKETLKALSGIKRVSSSFKPIEVLSERESEILGLLCDGLSPKEIAERLFVSPRTVDTHKNNIMQKFEVNTVSKLISVALKNKIV